MPARFQALTAPVQLPHSTLYRCTKIVTYTGSYVFAVGYAVSAVLAPPRVADFRVPKPWREVDRAAPCVRPPGIWGLQARTESTLDPILCARDETRTSRILLFGAIPVPVPNPKDEPNRCNLRQQTPKRPRKPLYLGFFG